MTPFMGEELARSRREALIRAAEGARLARQARTHERPEGRDRPSLRVAVGLGALSLGLRLLGDG